MAIYKNISAQSGIGGGSPVTLITKGSGVSGSISVITIANHDNSDSNVINLFLTDGTNTYVIVETTIPPRASLVLNENLAFDSSVYNLKITTNSTAELTVTIK